MTVRSLAVILLAACLAGCGTFREIGRPPKLSDVPLSPAPDLYPVDLKTQKPIPRASLWDDRHASLLTGRRTLDEGDILTVLIAINDRAQVRNQSDRSRTASRSIGLGGSYDIAGIGADASADLSAESSADYAGSGATVRSETIRLQVAATVNAVMPNGILLISGTQEVLVNAELRVLTIAGYVRPNDIGPDNTVSYERIAEARIAYGGRGRLSEVQQPPWGQQLFDRLSPI